MSETRRRKNKAAQADTPEAPTKVDFEIAKYLRNKCPKKQTMFFNEKVYYFIGSKAIDVLLDSKWAKESTSKKDREKDVPSLSNRNLCEDYLNRLLGLGVFFVRAEKIVVVKKEKPEKVKDKGSKNGKQVTEKEDENGEGNKNKKGKKNAEKEKEKEKAAKEEKTDEASEGDTESPKTDRKDGDKKRKKIRLEHHQDQVFLDSSDAYVWIYEPTSVKNIVLGTAIVLGAIGVCLFPLWPPIVRQGVYYLSLVMVGLIGVLIAVSLFRYVVFGAVWLMTAGKLKFWYLPNLTEDCGFFESFAPLYSCSRKGDPEEKKSKGKKSSKKTEDGNKSENEALETGPGGEGDAPETVAEPANAESQAD